MVTFQKWRYFQNLHNSIRVAVYYICLTIGCESHPFRVLIYFISIVAIEEGVQIM